MAIASIHIFYKILSPREIAINAPWGRVGAPVERGGGRGRLSHSRIIMVKLHPVRVWISAVHRCYPRAASPARKPSHPSRFAPTGDAPSAIPRGSGVKLRRRCWGEARTGPGARGLGQVSVRATAPGLRLLAGALDGSCCHGPSRPRWPTIRHLEILAAVVLVASASAGGAASYHDGHASGQRRTRAPVMGGTKCPGVSRRSWRRPARQVNLTSPAPAATTTPAPKGARGSVLTRKSPPRTRSPA